MSGLGLRLFGAKLRKRPASAVAFWLVLVASKRPLAWLEQRRRRPLRAGIIAWVARRARG
jgi:hypothetical protein